MLTLQTNSPLDPFRQSSTPVVLVVHEPFVDGRGRTRTDLAHCHGVFVSSGCFVDPNQITGFDIVARNAFFEIALFLRDRVPINGRKS